MVLAWLIVAPPLKSASATKGLAAVVEPESMQMLAHDGGGGVVESISIPLINALLVTDVNVITNCPLEFAAAVNCWMFAMFCPPDAATMSKFVNTCVPLMLTLNTREPVVVKNVSAKCRRTRELVPGLKPGTV